MNLQLSTFHTQLTHLEKYRDIKQDLSHMSCISLSEMSDAALLNRVDTKYLIPIEHLPVILNQLQGNYRVLDVDGVRLNHYHTVYYDEPNFTFYKQHHNHYGDRYKVRARQYVDSNVSFFEVKHKTNKKRTIKSRLPLSHEFAPLSHELDIFIEHHVPVNSDHLEPKIWNNYLRFTLVDSSKPERVTLDMGLEFGHDKTHVSLSGFAIAEVKQTHFTHESPFIQQMRHLSIRSRSFSKYCAGVYLLYDNVKKNNFKPIMLQVKKLAEMERFHERIY